MAMHGPQQRQRFRSGELGQLRLNHLTSEHLELTADSADAVVEAEGAGDGLATCTP
jgi:hypothetical protein